MPEFYIVTALPYSVAHDATHHVSLYIAPRIVSGVETELGRWNLFPNWADRVRSATIELTADVGVIECDAIRDPVDPTVSAGGVSALHPGARQPGTRLGRTRPQMAQLLRRWSTEYRQGPSHGGHLRRADVAATAVESPAVARNRRPCQNTRRLLRNSDDAPVRPRHRIGPTAGCDR